MDSIILALFLVGIVAAVSFFWKWYKLRYFSYWKEKQIPTLSPTVPTGDIGAAAFGLESLFISVKKIYEEFKKQGHRHGGIYFFNGPVYVPVDLELVKAIMVKDFDHFVDRSLPSNNKKFHVGNLFSLSGTTWKNARSKISPLFSSSKLREMYNVIVEATNISLDYIDSKIQADGLVDIHDAITKSNADITTCIILGLEGKENLDMAEIIETILYPSKVAYFKRMLSKGFSRPEKLVEGVQASEQKLKYFNNIVEETLKNRVNNPKAYKDFLTYLLEIRDKGDISARDVLGFFFGFFVAGHDTAPNIIARCLHELAHNQRVQDKLRSEIFEKLGNDIKKFSYEDLLKLKYLDMVVDETSRFYPTLPILIRICTKAYQIPGSTITLEEGTPVVIPVLGIHYDPNYYPNPEKFYPERFEDQKALSGTLLPFGIGPRQCVGLRYGQLQTKLSIAALVVKYKFIPSDKTSRHLEYNKPTTSLSTPLKGGIWVKTEKIVSDET